MVWRVYCLYHKVHSAGWGNVWCSHCDWQEQPPLLIPLVLLHDISGKDIPLLVKPSLVLSLFFVHPPFFLTLSFRIFLSFFIVVLHFSPFLNSYLSFLSSLNTPSSSLSLPRHCPPPCPTNMAVFGFVGRGWSSEGAEIIAMAIHIKTGQKEKGGRVFTHWQACYYSYSRRSWKSLRLIWELSHGSVKGH